MTDAKTAIAEATADAVTVRGHDLTSRADGPPHADGDVLPAAHGPGAGRARAAHDRRLPRGDRRARARAERAGRADDAVGGAGVAAGRGRRRAARVRLGDPRRHRVRGDDAARRRSPPAPSRSSDRARAPRGAPRRCPASATRCTRTATRAPCACSRCPTSSASPASTSRWCARSRRRCPRSTAACCRSTSRARSPRRCSTSACPPTRSRRSRCSRAPPACSATCARSTSARSASGSPPRRGRDRVRRRMSLHAPRREARPAEQRARDEAALRQLASLRERSPFYRDKLAGVEDAPYDRRCRSRPRTRSARRWPPSRRSAATSRRRSRTCGGSTRPAARPATRSYIAVTEADLDGWTEIGARSYAATGIAPSQRAVLTYNSGPFVAGAVLDAWTRIGATDDPGRQRQHRAARAGLPGARRRGARLHAVLRALPRRLVPRARDRAARARRAPVLRRRRARRGRGRDPRTRSRRRSARPCARRWGSPTSRPRCGASARSRPACTSRARATSTSS